MKKISNSHKHLKFKRSEKTIGTKHFLTAVGVTYDRPCIKFQFFGRKIDN